jgi:3-dehydroquinate synthase
MPFRDASGLLGDLISCSVKVKGRIVEEDPRETGTRRMLLNLGHSFGHALEASAGLGVLSHGEAVAWGLARAAELGVAAGITPHSRAVEIIRLLGYYGYETRTPHPLSPDLTRYREALEGDKKKRKKRLVFVVPAEEGACLYPSEGVDPLMLNTLLQRVLQGEYCL